MADAVWPGSLPAEPRLKEYSETPPDLVLRSAVSAGPAKTRRRNGANVRTARFAFDMTQAQWETFDEFFVETIAGGALAFELTRPSTQNLADWRIVGLPEYTPLTPHGVGRWVVRFEAELLPGTEQVDGGPEEPPPNDELQSMAGPGNGWIGDAGEEWAALARDVEELEPYPEDIYALSGAAPPAQEDYHMLQPQDYAAGFDDASPSDALDLSLAEVFLGGDAVTDTEYGGPVEEGDYGGGIGGGGIGVIS
jgi:hypothetical protein